VLWTILAAIRIAQPEHDSAGMKGNLDFITNWQSANSKGVSFPLDLLTIAVAAWLLMDTDLKVTVCSVLARSAHHMMPNFFFPSIVKILLGIPPINRV
jgi:hypothetical protein